MILVIGTSVDIGEKGKFYWKGEFFNKIISFNQIDINKQPVINSAIVYFTKACYKNNRVFKLKIADIKITDNKIFINYETEKPLEFKSYQVQKSLKEYFNINNITLLPFCLFVEEDKFIEILSDNKLISDIEFLQSKNDWNGIYNMLKNYFPLEKSFIWNNAVLLNKFSFATAKLSECTNNFKKIFCDKKSRQNYLNEKRALRELTIKMRKRCIELHPQISTYYSELAYSYYQSTNELIKTGGRKDGNVIKEADKALTYINKAIQLNPKNIKDYYRKGILLSEILIKYNIYADKDKTSNEIKENTINLLKASVLSFNELIKNYEQNLEKNKINKKYYVKALYHLSLTYIKLFKTEVKVDDLIVNNDFSNINDYNNFVNYLISSDAAIDKCILADFEKEKKSNSFVDLIDYNNHICGVYKAYVKGTVNLYLYLMKKEEKNRILSNEFLMKANEVRYPKELERQSKIFVLDKLALLNIIDGKYEVAIKILKPIFDKGKLPTYAIYTLTIALIKNNDITFAETIIKKQLESTEELFKIKFNKLYKAINSSEMTRKYNNSVS